MAMSADFNATIAHRVEDELGISSRELVQTLLDHMVTIQVLNEVDDLVLQGMDDDLNLSRGGDELDHLLKSSCAMLIESDPNHVSSSVLD